VSERRVIDNPISGETIVIRESGDQNGGQLLRFDIFLPAGGHVPAGHVHPKQEERFTVVRGRIRFRLGHRRILASPGDTVVIPAGRAHWFGNPGAEVAHAQVEVRPALRMEEMFEATEALSKAGHLPGTRLPPLTALAQVLVEFRQELAVPHVPAPLALTVLAPLARLGRSRRRHTAL
jgi:quercetin dioxygenase-like cupin family protein